MREPRKKEKRLPPEVSKRRVFAPSFVAILRIILSFAAISLFSISASGAIVALILTIIAIYMDSLDGYLARRLGVASELGALVDITADRIVEHVFWIYFAVAGMVGVWVPIVVVTRSFLVDTVRSVAFSKGKTPFAMMHSGLTHFLVASRFMRSLYGVAKVAVFVMIGAMIALERSHAEGIVSVSAGVMENLDRGKQGLVVLVVALNLIRGFPVLWDSREFLVEKIYPKELRDDA